MLLFRASLGLFLSSALVAVPALASRVHKVSPTSHAHLSTLRGHKGRIAARNGHVLKAHAKRGQQAIEPSRVTEIQQALIHEHYLSGEANGQWDSTTQAAMQKYQADQGWQIKLMPDSRALKKLGLGPDYSGAINAKEGNFVAPSSASNSTPQTSGFVAASGVNQ